ncbi:Cadherin-17 Intestinal peptide-associated transporter HPT-1 [Triplophysa tibetana]|uniref:Cadherin-17 Intestinal peptide-associated transporter HPT-1 n=1 Tax=Triplophysa tibetana TaxID=1572043 RepID=A0A5A9MZY8_9TELE|nr:Cadherin-17 Intestinal peptide-associated transporter HPT-1 [Triplophysa tibetana]
MMSRPHLLYLAVLVSIAHGMGLDSKKGPLQNKVLDVPEATHVPYPIYQFTSTVEGVSSYLVNGETEGKISISSDGWLYLEQELEWSPEKSHHLEIEALSADGERLDGPYKVVLHVIDVNNNPPVFSSSQYSGRVREHSPAGIPFVQVSASDADDPETPNAHLRFSIDNQIPSPTNTPYFGINSENGEIFVTEEGQASLRARPTLTYKRGEVPGNADVLKRKFEDYCTPKSLVPLEHNPFFTCVQRSETRQMNLLQDPDYALIVRVEDLGGNTLNALSNTVRVNIAVIQNLWINPGPVMIRENLQAEYPMHLVSVRANDPDALYRLLQKERAGPFPFTISEDGEIFVTGPLDREEKNMYILVVIAEDQQGVQLEKPMEISVRVQDENDNGPLCDEAVFEVQENEPSGSVVGFLRAFDADEEDSLNSLLNYTLLSQTPTSPSSKMFHIDQVKAKIQVANIKFRRSEVPQYELLFSVSDGVHTTKCKAIIRVIDINNEIPIYEKNDPQMRMIQEPGSSKVEYHITHGDPHNLFAIKVDETTGEGIVYIAQPLDYEVQGIYHLQIDARNQEPLVSGVEYDERSKAVVVIQLVDVDEPPKFEVEALNVNIAENFTVGDLIMKAEARDPEGKTIKFRMEEDEQGWLQLDVDSGELKTKAALDREKVEELTIKIVAYETEGNKQESEMTVIIHLQDVNDNYPVLQKTQGFICVQKMTPLTLTAVDTDNHPFSEPFTFSIPRKSPNWEIKPVDGTSAHLILKKKPSSEQRISVPINIKDNVGLGVTQKIDVHVCNCTSLGYCYIEPEAHGWKMGLSGTIGILGGVFGFIVLFLIIIMYRIKKKNKKNAAAGGETRAML